jgi:hypothetical protein
MDTKLPNAPLTEVVFEMQWEVLESPGNLQADPGYPIIFDAFTSYASKRGFTRIQDLQHPYTGVGRSVSRRFFREENNFPILQIGHGATEFKLELPSFWDGKLMGVEKRGRLLIETDVRKLPGAIFSIDLASAQQKESPVIRMETKVTSRAKRLLPIRQADRSMQRLDDWLEKAHEATSICFRELIKPQVFEKFK